MTAIQKAYDAFRATFNTTAPELQMSPLERYGDRAPGPDGTAPAKRGGRRFQNPPRPAARRPDIVFGRKARRELPYAPTPGSEALPGEMRLADFLALEIARRGLSRVGILKRIQRGDYPGLTLRKAAPLRVFVRGPQVATT